jgi:hypothetical protein
MFCISRIVRTGKCFGFKQWRLLSAGNLFFVDWEARWGGGGHNFLTLFWNVGQIFATECGKNGVSFTQESFDFIYGRLVRNG